MSGDVAKVPSAVGRGRNDDQLGGRALLVAEMRRELRRWRIATVNYGITYYLSRSVLVIASSVVAVRENLDGGYGQWLIALVPFLAMVVAILTALDTWLKPQQKWRGFMESRDRLADLMMQFGPQSDLDQIRTKFSNLRAKHRERNIF